MNICKGNKKPDTLPAPRRGDIVELSGTACSDGVYFVVLGAKGLVMYNMEDGVVWNSDNLFGTYLTPEQVRIDTDKYCLQKV